MLVNLDDLLKPAQREHYGVGLFNTTDTDMLQAAIEAAEELKSPIILGTAEVLLPYGDLPLIAPALLAAAKRAAAVQKDAKREKAASAPAPTNAAERVIAVEGDGKDVLDTLKGQLSHEEFSQVTNAMTQMRARLAEKAKGRMDFLASINLDGMSADERKNHAKFLELM